MPNAITIEQILTQAEQGVPCLVDLQRRTVRLGKTTIPAADLDLSDFHDEAPLQTIETLYARYKHSVPSERSESRRRRYFNALPEDQLSGDDFLYGDGRDEARARLELHLLAATVSGQLTWDEPSMGKWFWQSKEDPDLVILRNWIEPATQIVNL